MRKTTKDYITFVAKFFDGANWSYMVSGSPICFCTKKQAAKYIRNNFNGDTRKAYLNDLKRA